MRTRTAFDWALVPGPSFLVRAWSFVRTSSSVPGALSSTVVLLLLTGPAFAADHVGRVTLASGAAVPGARVTATQGSTTLVTTTDTQGAYRFAGIADGTWAIQVEMVGLSVQRREVTIGAGAAVTEWQLSMLPFAEITRGIPVPPPAPPQDAARRTAPRTDGRAAGPGSNGAAPATGSFQRAGVAPSTSPANPAAAAAAAAAAAQIAAGRGGGPAPPSPPAGDGADALLVSGTVNAGGAQPSVGNVNRPTGIRLFRGQVTFDGANSAWDARQPSLTGITAAKPDTSAQAQYNRLRAENCALCHGPAATEASADAEATAQNDILPANLQARFAEFDPNKDEVLDKDEIKKMAEKLSERKRP